MGIDFAQGTWEILACLGCEDVTFRTTWYTSEDPEPTIELLPPRHERMLKARLFYSVPPTLLGIYREAIHCFNESNNILCAAGIRALIEGICVDKEINDGPVPKQSGGSMRRSTMQGKIEGMVEADFLTREHAETLHQLRFLGNEALHELRAPTSDELRLAIGIAEHVMEGLYDLSEKADLLGWRRSRRSKASERKMQG